jgi:arylsulfatase A-like enzyme
VNRFIRHLRLALSVGLVGGFVLGCVEALVTIEANAFAQPGQYFWLYLSVPILTGMGLGALFFLPVGLVVGFFSGRREPSVALGAYAALLIGAGGLSFATLWVGAIEDRLHSVGHPLGLGGRLALWTVSLLVVAGAAATLGAAASWYAARTRSPLRAATRVVLVAALPLLWPVGHFFASDWKWESAARLAAAAMRERPNVLLISIDTLRADYLGTYGDRHELTPHLDRFANEGVVFEQTITSSPWTLPAISSLLTGLYPRHHGAGEITDRRDPLGRSALPPGTWTLPSALHQQGYLTHAIVTNPYLALRYRLGGGFDGYENVTIESEAFLSFSQTTAVRLINWLDPGLIIGDRGEAVSARAEQWLARTGRSRPFFLWLHYIDPHPPYSRPGVSRHKSFRGDTLFAPAGDDNLRLTSPDVARLRSGEIRLNPEQKEQVRQLYRAEVRSVDGAVGEVLDTLDKAGLRKNTLVIVVADHGEEFWEHGGVEHGHTVYEELVHVPLLMRWPGHLPAGERVAPVTRMVDVAPTVLDLLGIEAQAGLDGKTLLPLVRGTEQQPRVALSENLLFAEERVGLRTATQKYIRWDTGKEEVYDLAQDPHERCDLAGIPAIVEPLRHLYDAMDHIIPKTSSRGAQPTLDDGGEAALRSLGYVQ